MYVGRLLVVSPEAAAYRVSSRSFPNRKIVEREGALTVVPTTDAPATDNPYVSYNCLRTIESAGGPHAAIGNGTQVDAVAEKLELGYPARDALANSLLAYDFEKDDYDTPRIAAVLGPDPMVGIVRRDALLVEPVEESILVATYEEDRPTPIDLADGALDSAEGAARTAYELDYEHAVCAAGVARDGNGLRRAVENGESD